MVPTGNMNYVQDNMFLGQMPKRLVIGYVDSNALNGIITKNLFNFKHYILALNVDGKQIPSIKHESGSRVIFQNVFYF
jgi:hypothetical protein